MTKGIVIFSEGDSEEFFYKNFLENIRSLTQNSRFPLSHVILCNLKGIGNYKHKAYRIFTKKIIPKNPNTSFKIFLCYDSDVFEFSQNPPVNWAEVEKILLENGATKVIHVKAKQSIEDWFLVDLIGICDYLKLPHNTKCSGQNSARKLKALFEKANKVYIKGKSIDFIKSLNIKKIMQAHCHELKPLCKELGIKCNEKTGKCCAM